MKIDKQRWANNSHWKLKEGGEGELSRVVKNKHSQQRRQNTGAEPHNAGNCKALHLLTFIYFSVLIWATVQTMAAKFSRIRKSPTKRFLNKCAVSSVALANGSAQEDPLGCPLR